MPVNRECSRIGSSVNPDVNSVATHPSPPVPILSDHCMILLCATSGRRSNGYSSDEPEGLFAKWSCNAGSAQRRVTRLAADNGERHPPTQLGGRHSCVRGFLSIHHRTNAPARLFSTIARGELSPLFDQVTAGEPVHMDDQAASPSPALNLGSRADGHCHGRLAAPAIG